MASSESVVFWTIVCANFTPSEIEGLRITGCEIARRMSEVIELKEDPEYDPYKGKRPWGMGNESPYDWGSVEWEDFNL